MRILYIFHDSPYPPNCGERWVSYTLLNYMSSRHECHFMTFHPNQHSHLFEEFGRALPSARMIHEEPRRDGFFLKARQSLTSLCGQRIPSSLRWQSRTFSSKVQQCLAQTKYDLIHFDGINMMYYRPLAGSLKTIINTNDAISLRYDRRSEAETSLWQRWSCKRIARIIEQEEKRMLPKFDAVRVISRSDASWLESHCGLSNVFVVGLALDSRFTAQTWSRPTAGRPTLLACGDIAEAHIREPLRVFLREDWPKLLAELPSTHLVILGRSSKKLLGQEIDSSPNVTYLTWVEDYLELLLKSDLAVFFDSGGSGTKNRVLQALGVGLPCLGTPYAFNGMEVQNGTHCFIEDSTGAFLPRILALFKAPQGLGSVSRAAKKYAISNHSVEKTGAMWEDWYRRIIAGDLPWAHSTVANH